MVESTLYRVEISNRGGVVKSWKLKKYFDDQKPPQPLELVDPDGSAQLGWPFSLVLSDAQLESRANSALYRSDARSDSVSAPCEITFHWSDGHLDITKKLNFTQDYEMSVDVSATLDGRPDARRHSRGAADLATSLFTRPRSSSRSSTNQNGKLNLLQYKKLGVSGNQSQPARASRAHGISRHRGSVLHGDLSFPPAPISPSGTGPKTTRSRWTISPVPSRKRKWLPAQRLPGRSTCRLYVGPKDLVILSQVKPSLEEQVNFGWTGVIAKPLLFITPVASPLHSELGLDDRHSHACSSTSPCSR